MNFNDGKNKLVKAMYMDNDKFRAWMNKGKSNRDGDENIIYKKLSCIKTRHFYNS